MVKIEIVGKCDKRIITYPLIRACSIAGKTLIITNDISYKRLYYGDGDTGEIEGVEIQVVSKMEGCYMDPLLITAKENSIDYIIFITEKDCNLEVKKTFHLLEFHMGFIQTYIEETVEKERVSFGILTLEKVPKMIKPENKTLHQLLWRPEYSIYLMEIEEKKSFKPLLDKRINEVLAYEFAEVFELKPNDMMRLLKRKKFYHRNLLVKG